MSNWRTMEAGDELDRLIAERLGYTDFEMGQDFWWAWRPVRENETEHDLKYHLKDGKIQDPIGHYSTDLNAAFSLPTKDEYYLDLHGPTEEYADWNAFVSWVWADEYDEHPNARGEADTGALALCRAWLAWKESSRG